VDYYLGLLDVFGILAVFFIVLGGAIFFPALLAYYIWSKILGRRVANTGMMAMTACVVLVQLLGGKKKDRR